MAIPTLGGQEAGEEIFYHIFHHFHYCQAKSKPYVGSVLIPQCEFLIGHDKRLARRSHSPSLLLSFPSALDLKAQGFGVIIIILG